jgi:POLQ-like helicase
MKRFYITLIIYELWKNNKSVWKVSNEFSLDRGFIQTIIQSSATFSNNVLHFCQNLDEFWPYRHLLYELFKQLQYNCSQTELIPLLELENVKLARAQQLYNAGFKTIELVAASNSKDMIAKIMNLPVTAAEKIIKCARIILKERAEALQDEAENLLLQMFVNE